MKNNVKENASNLALDRIAKKKSVCIENIKVAYPLGVPQKLYASICSTFCVRRINSTIYAMINFYK